MIIKNVCLFLEALSIVICLHHLYGEKFRLDIATISFLSINMIIMTAINYFGLSKTYTMIIYPIIILYCGIRFGFQIKALAVNIVLCVILIGGVQLCTVFGLSVVKDIISLSDLRLLFTNCITTLVTVLILPVFKVERLSARIRDKGKILLTTFCICILMVLFLLVSYKELEVAALEPIILLFISFIFILLLSGQLNAYKIKAKEVETELKMQKLYANSFRGLIEDIRLRQHEFDNHISTIYSQHYKYHTYEELVDVQKEYCKIIAYENRFNRILSGGNSIIVGFLYVRLAEIDKRGINVSYQVKVKELEIGIPSYKIIEILGDLINNAVEALLVYENGKRLHVSVIELDNFYIEVMNESPYIDYRELGMFFSKNYSKKGENRGLGLYNVKLICEEYGLSISCQNIELDGSNWLSFRIWKERETI